ncbi:MAG: hypothetical protein D6759_20280, partial [Chloroflexi bacterium]
MAFLIAIGLLGYGFLRLNQGPCPSPDASVGAVVILAILTYSLVTLALLLGSRWSVLLAAAVSFLLLTFVYQAYAPVRLQCYQAEWTGNTSYGLLRVRYPRFLPLEKETRPSPITVWLPRSTVSHTLTFTVPPTLLLTTGEEVSSPPLTTLRASPSEVVEGYLHRVPTQTFSAQAVVEVDVLEGGKGSILKPPPLRLRVDVESARSAGWRHLWDLLLGPTTPLLGLAVTVVGWAWQSYQQRRRKREERLRQIAALPSLEKDERLRRFRQFWREADREGDWDALKALQELWDASWRQDALTTAAEALSKGGRGEAEGWIQVVETFDGRADPEVRAWRNLLDSPKGASEVGERVHACVLLAGRPYGKRLGSLLGERLHALLEQPRGVAECEQAVLKHPRGRWLLRQELIRNFLEDKAQRGEKDSLPARRLLILADQEMVWPPLWPSPRPDDPDPITKALELLGWSANPFGPENAEDEANLLSFFVEPPHWSEIRESRSLVLTGATGAGRTATLLLLTNEVQKQGAFFPVWLPPRSMLAAASHQRLLPTLIGAIARALLSFFVLNPDHFREMTPARRQPILEMIRSALSPPELEEVLRGEGADDDLTTTLLQSAIRVEAPPQEDEPILLALLSRARLTEFHGYALFLDLSAPWDAFLPSPLLWERVRPLLKMVPRLEKAHCHLKIAVPTPQGFVPITVESVHLEWSPERLGKVLDQRLRRVGGESLAQLFGPDRPDDPDGWIVEAAQGSPRRLVRLGNRLLEGFGEKGRLSIRDLEAAVEEEDKVMG